MTSLTHISGYAHVAERYGFEEAVFLDAIMFWYRSNRGDDRNFRDGRWWTYNSVKAYEEIFPWWNAGQIRRIISRCREKGALLAGDYNQDRRDRTAWYSPSDELLALYGENENCICRKQQMQVSESSGSVDENGKCNIRKPCSNHVETDMNTPYSPPTGDASAETSKPKKSEPKYNDKCSWRELELHLAANFGRHDMVPTLTYDDDHLPADKQAAAKCFQTFVRKWRTARKRRGEELRYIYVTEGWHGKSEDERFGGDGRLEDRRLHHHAVVNGVGSGDLEEIRSLWQYGGYIRAEPVDVHYYRELAKYLTKEAREFGRAQPGERVWRSSRNTPAEKAAIYEDSINLLGVAKVQLPAIAYPCVTISGAGMMGNMEVPLYGMVDSMTMNINWLTPHGDAVKLLSPKKHQLDMRVAEEYWDVTQAEVGSWTDKYVVIVRPKSFTPGNIAPMAAADTSGEYAVYYFAAYKDGKQLWEIDKRNMKCVIDGVDYMADVRKALGK